MYDMNFDEKDIPYTSNHKVREEEENNLPQMKKLFFLYVWLNLTRIAGLRKENLVKHIRKRTIQTGRLFFSSSLTTDLVQVPQQEEVVFEEVMFQFGENLVNAQKDIDTGIKELIDDHFFDLFK